MLSLCLYPPVLKKKGVVSSIYIIMYIIFGVFVVTIIIVVVE
jgi:hypothetical protein